MKWISNSLLVLLVYAVSTCCAVAQNEKDADPLVLTMSLDKKEALVAEPVFLTATFFNSGPNPITWMNPVFLGSQGNLFIAVKHKEQMRPGMLVGRGYELHGKDSLRLQPKEKRFMEMNFANLSVPLSVGENTIHAIYSVQVNGLNPAAREGIQRLGIKVWEGQIVSNQEKLIVQEPTGIDLEVFKLLKLDVMLTRPGVPGMFYGSAEAEKVLAQYPESRYAKYCRYYLGSRYAFTELDKGLSYLRRFIEENPNHPLADDAQYSIVSNLEEKNRVEEASRELDKFFADYPQSDLLIEAERLNKTIARRQLVQPHN
jgi:hypothetical protein